MLADLISWSQNLTTLRFASHLWVHFDFNLRSQITQTDLDSSVFCPKCSSSAFWKISRASGRVRLGRLANNSMSPFLATEEAEETEEEEEAEEEEEEEEDYSSEEESEGSEGNTSCTSDSEEDHHCEGGEDSRYFFQSKERRSQKEKKKKKKKKKKDE